LRSSCTFYPSSFVKGDYIYWSDWERRSLSRAKKRDGSDRIVLHENIPDLMGIKAAYPKRISNVSNGCAVKNGGCSHLCLYRPLGLVCMCPVGWELDANGETCIIPEAFLMFTQRDIVRVSLSSEPRGLRDNGVEELIVHADPSSANGGNISERQALKHAPRDILRVSLSSFPTNLDSLRLHNVSQPLALDFHYKSNRIYWTGSEGTTGTICRAYLNGSNMELILTAGLEYMEGIAIDWLAENLYWSDSGHLHIEMSKLDGKSRRIIVWKNTNPRALVVHPAEGYLYWADWLDPPTLQRSELDGRNRITLLKDVGRIFALTLDYSSNRLYWSEVDAPSIQSVDLNGGSRRFVVQEPNMKPTVLTEFGDFLYWANWRKQSIEISDKATGLNRSTLHLDLHFIINLIAVHALKQRGWNHCATRRNYCEHLCIFMPDRSHKTPYRCSCPSHYALSSDKRSCTAPKKFILFSQHSTVRRMKVKERQDMEEYPIVEDVRLSHVDLEQAFDIALDPYSQTLFWTCELTNSVNATRLLAGEVRPVGTIIANAQYKPRSLAIYPKK
uniref:EGF-like domain-containing protein n=1 Tax=Soboliphyme baturini TaxID=241478 RepID=A0A183J7M1_9BILA